MTQEHTTNAASQMPASSKKGPVPFRSPYRLLNTKEGSSQQPMGSESAQIAGATGPSRHQVVPNPPGPLVQGVVAVRNEGASMTPFDEWSKDVSFSIPPSSAVPSGPHASVGEGSTRASSTPLPPNETQSVQTGLKRNADRFSSSESEQPRKERRISNPDPVAGLSVPAQQYAQGGSSPNSHHPIVESAQPSSTGAPPPTHPADGDVPVQRESVEPILTLTDNGRQDPRHIIPSPGLHNTLTLDSSLDPPHFVMANARRRYDQFEEKSGQLISACGALIPEGYTKDKPQRNLPWKCPMRLASSNYKCSLYFAALSELGAHFAAVHRLELLRDDGDGYFTHVGKRDHQPGAYHHVNPLVVARAASLLGQSSTAETRVLSQVKSTAPAAAATQLLALTRGPPTPSEFGLSESAAAPETATQSLGPARPFISSMPSGMSHSENMTAPEAVTKLLDSTRLPPTPSATNSAGKATAPNDADTKSEVIWRYFLPIFCRLSEKRGEDLEHQGLELMNLVLSNERTSKLATRPKQRDVVQREGHTLSLKTPRDVEAFLIYITGHVSRWTCKNCANGLGPFDGCILPPNKGELVPAFNLENQCANCKYARTPCNGPKESIASLLEQFDRENKAALAARQLQEPAQRRRGRGRPPHLTIPIQFAEDTFTRRPDEGLFHNHAIPRAGHNLPSWDDLPSQDGLNFNRILPRAPATGASPIPSIPSGGGGLRATAPAAQGVGQTPRSAVSRAKSALVRPLAARTAAASTHGSTTSLHGSRTPAATPVQTPPPAAPPTNMTASPAVSVTGLPGARAIGDSSNKAQLLGDMIAKQRAATSPAPRTIAIAGSAQSINTTSSPTVTTIRQNDLPAARKLPDRNAKALPNDSPSYAAEVAKTEKWELAPGRLRSVTSEHADNIAYSRTYLSGTQPVRVCKEAYCVVRPVSPGSSYTFDKSEDTVRLCSVVLGKLHVQLEGEPIFVLGILGVFKIRPGVACTVANEMCMDAILQITSILVDS